MPPYLISIHAGTVSTTCLFFATKHNLEVEAYNPPLLIAHSRRELEARSRWKPTKIQKLMIEQQFDEQEGEQEEQEQHIFKIQVCIKQ